ncbi:MAG: hypothetical protein KY460_14110, partial [Actinobacteria bacterium]|nr:hypothetical protein [Actinomycetota bacterium]
MTDDRIDPFRADPGEIEGLLTDQPAFRERQVRQWLARGVTDPSQMTDLPLALRDRLAERLPPAPTTLRHMTADDGLTHKVLLGLEDGEAI